MLRDSSALVFVFELGLGLTGLSSCSHTPRSPQPELAPCTLGDSGLRARCGDLTVPENPEAPQGKHIPIHFAVLRGTSTNTRSAMLVLVGGPGQAGTVSGAFVAKSLSEVRRHHDVVLIDQRGTGQSNPLTCPGEEIPLSARFSHSQTADDVAKCLTTLAADTTQYTTPSAIADFEHVRQALGYSHWHLWGASYGTRVALAYMQAHPESVNRVILDGVAPTDMKLPLHAAGDMDRSLEALVASCRDTPDCSAAHPELASLLPRLLNKLGADGTLASVAHPARGTPETIRLSRDGLLEGVRTLLYSSELTPLLPFALHSADTGNDWAPFVGALYTVADLMSKQPIHDGMYLSVLCAEDVPRISDREVADFTQNTLFGDSLVAQARNWCARWRAATLPERYFSPITAEHPTLVFSGARDPVTPPRWGALVAERLPNALHVSVGGASHGVTPLGCAPSVIAEFLSSDTPLRTDTSCLAALSQPSFFTRRTGP